MLSTVEYKNNTWTITEEGGYCVVAEQIIGDFKIMRDGVGRGKVLISHGVPQQQIHHLPQVVMRRLGIGTPMTSITAKAPAPGFRRLRCLPGGVVEPYYM